VVELTTTLNEVVIGDDITLTCTVTRANPAGSFYTWTHNGTIVTPTTITSLRHASVEAEDVGNYSCSVSNGVEPTGMDSLIISFLEGGKQKIS